MSLTSSSSILFLLALLSIIIHVHGSYFGSSSTNTRRKQGSNIMTSQQVVTNLFPTVPPYLGPTTLTIDEDVTLILPFPIKILDDASPSCASLNVKLELYLIFPDYILPGTGRLSFWPGYDSIDPRNVDNATTIQLWGTIDAINWGLSNVKYIPDRYMNGLESISVTVDDGGSCLLGATALQNSYLNYVTINVLATNNPPDVRLVGSPDNNTMISIWQDTPTPLSFSLFDVDANENADKIILNLTAEHGWFTCTPPIGAGSVLVDTPSFKSFYAIRGMYLQTVLSQLVFYPSPRDWWGIARLIIDADDEGHSPPNHGTNRSRFILRFNVSMLLDVPIVYANITALNLNVMEDSIDNPFQLAIIDNHDDADRRRRNYMAITIQLTSGSLTFGSFSSLVKMNASQNAWTIYGTIAQAIAATGQIKYTPPPDFFGPVNVTVDVELIGNVMMNAGVAPRKYNTTIFSFSVIPVNDAPRVTPHQTLRFVYENQPLNFTDLVVYDIDTSTPVSLNITCRGNFSLSMDPASLQIPTVPYLNQKQIIIPSLTLAKLNTLLNGSVYRNVDPWNSDVFQLNVNAADKFPMDTLYITVNDLNTPTNGIATFSIAITASADVFSTCQEFINVHNSYCGCYYVTTPERQAPGSPWVVLSPSLPSNLVLRSEPFRGRFLQGCCGLYTPSEREQYLKTTGKMGLCTGQEILGPV